MIVGKYSLSSKNVFLVFHSITWNTVGFGHGIDCKMYLFYSKQVVSGANLDSLLVIMWVRDSVVAWRNVTQTTLNERERFTNL